MNIKSLLLTVLFCPSFIFSSDARENCIIDKRIEYNWLNCGKWAACSLVTGAVTVAAFPSVPFVAAVGAAAWVTMPSTKNDASMDIPTISPDNQNGRMIDIGQVAQAVAITGVLNAVMPPLTPGLNGIGKEVATSAVDQLTRNVVNDAYNGTKVGIAMAADATLDFIKPDRVIKRQSAEKEAKQEHLDYIARQVEAIQLQKEANAIQKDMAKAQYKAAQESEGNTKELKLMRASQDQLAREMRTTEQYMKKRDKFDLEKMIRGEQ